MAEFFVRVFFIMLIFFVAIALLVFWINHRSSVITPSEWVVLKVWYTRVVSGF